MGIFLSIAWWAWLERLGGIGLILLALADNSVVPLPGSMDALTVVLAAHEKDWWPYYAAMAVIGAVFGGYLTYVLGRKGGKQALEKVIHSFRRLRETTQIRDRFLHVVAHELRTPLQAILGWVRLLRGGKIVRLEHEV